MGGGGAVMMGMLTGWGSSHRWGMVLMVLMVGMPVMMITDGYAVIVG